MNLCNGTRNFHKSNHYYQIIEKCDQIMIYIQIIIRIIENLL